MKYLVLIKTKLDEYIAYRLNFIFWRVRNIFHLLLLFFLWQNIYKGSVSIPGYTEAAIFTYIFVANSMSALVLSSKTDQVGGDILNGNIINQLLKPINFFSYVGTREIADKIMNLVFSLIEVTLFLVVFRPPFLLQTDITAWITLIPFLCIALALSFLISFSLALIAFWSTEIWAPRFIFMVIISLVSGTLFPLTLLPDPIYATAMLTPFPYLIYVPTQIYLFGWTADTFNYLMVSLVWIGIFSIIARTLWHKGMKEFSFFGR
jgi:ABC-2 type transport system permease protein